MNGPRISNGGRQPQHEVPDSMSWPDAFMVIDSILLESYSLESLLAPKQFLTPAKWCILFYGEKTEPVIVTECVSYKVWSKPWDARISLTSVDKGKFLPTLPPENFVFLLRISFIL